MWYDLTLGSGEMKEASNVILLAIMLNDIFAHYTLDEDLENMCPSIVFALLLTCRIIIYLQVRVPLC